MESPLNGPQKTILVVEGNDLVLNTVRTILENANFTVLAAANAAAAIRLAASAKTIHMLLSGVMIPDMSGPDLALKLKELRPEMRVILMSGYPDGAIVPPVNLEHSPERRPAHQARGFRHPLVSPVFLVSRSKSCAEA